jgi:ABC-type transport system involved in cytochrome c biogenesis permease component
MRAEPAAIDRLTANRRLLLGVYVGLGLVATLAYLSQADIPFAMVVTTRRSGLRIILTALPAILPYIVSGTYARQLVSERRLGLYLFLAATAIGTVVASLVIIGTFDIPLNAVTLLFGYVLGQTAVYGLAAEFLLRVEWP